MKFTSTLPFVAALTSAFVLPPEQVLAEVGIEENHRAASTSEWIDIDQKAEKFRQIAKSLIGKTHDEVKQILGYTCSQNAIDEALEQAGEVAESVKDTVVSAAGSARAWFEEGFDDMIDAWNEDEDDHHDRPPHRRPGHGHKPPHHGNKPNLTVYQMIAESKYTTRLAELISDFPDIIDALNSTKANYTVFAPTDKAFAKIPKHAPKPSKEALEKFLSYHVVPDFYPAGRVLASHTAPTLLKSDHLGSKPLPQRLAFRFGFRGLTVNFVSRVVAANIFATNGVIHGVDTPIFLPFGGIQEIDLFPSEFSTLELALTKTGLLDKLNQTDHDGGTFFAPSNWAFKKLGPKVNAFLFSKYGLKYLKALLEYHVVPHNTLYSDAYYKGDAEEESVPKGRYHVDLPTLLEDKSVAVDIARFGGFISMKVNAYARVAIQDGIADDGVIHVMNDVVVPPKKIKDLGDEYWNGEELEVDDLVERLEPFVAKSDL